MLRFTDIKFHGQKLTRKVQMKSEMCLKNPKKQLLQLLFPSDTQCLSVHSQEILQSRLLRGRVEKEITETGDDKTVSVCTCGGGGPHS